MNLLNTDTQREGADSEKHCDDAGVSHVPKVSVIVPVYKVEKYLPECIESVLAQTFTDFELILVDDGSPDNSGKICDDYAARDSRIRVFHKENGGVSSARNLGIEKAFGEWIALIDGDDRWLSSHLENIFRAILAFSNVRVFYTGYTNDRVNDFNPVDSRFAFEVHDYWNFALRGKAIWTSCVCFHSSLPKEMPMFRTDLTHGEDLDVWRRMVKGRQVVMIPEVSAIYRIGSDNSAVASVPNPEKTIIWDLDFALLVDARERIYFTRVYYGFLFRYVPIHPSYFWKLIFQKHFWAIGGFPIFWLNTNLQRLKRKFPKR